MLPAYETRFPVVLIGVSIAVLKHYEHEEEKVYLILQPVVHHFGKLGQELIQTWRGVAF